MESGILNRGRKGWQVVVDGKRSAKFADEEKFKAFVEAIKADGKIVTIEECTVEDCEVWDL